MQFFNVHSCPFPGLDLLRQNTASGTSRPTFPSISFNASVHTVYDVKEPLGIPIARPLRLRSRTFLLVSLARHFIALFDNGENIVDLPCNQIHLAPQEYKDQEEEEEIDYPENPDNIHKRREGALNNLRGLRCANKLCSAKIQRQL
jgi:hypothetical protein